MRDRDPALGQDQLDVAQAQAEDVGSAGVLIGGSPEFRWPAATPWRQRRWRRDEGFGADVLGDEFRVLAEAVAGALDLDDDGVVEQAVEQRGGDDGVAEDLAPFATTLIRTAILSGVNPQAWLTDVLERMVRGEVRSTELASLLPWAWRPTGTAVAA